MRITCLAAQTSKLTIYYCRKGATVFAFCATVSSVHRSLPTITVLVCRLDSTPPERGMLDENDSLQNRIPEVLSVVVERRSTQMTYVHT